MKLKVPKLIIDTKTISQKGIFINSPAAIVYSQGPGKGKIPKFTNIKN